MLRYPDEYRERLLDVVTPLVERRFGPGVDAGLSSANRLRVALLRAGRRADLVALAAEEERSDGGVVQVAEAWWSRGGGLHLRLQVRLTDAAAEPWHGPAWLEDLRAQVLGEPTTDRVDLLVRGTDGARDRRISSGTLDSEGVATLAIDPIRAFGSRAGTTDLPLVARVRHAEHDVAATVRVEPSVVAAAGRSPLLAGRRATRHRARRGRAASSVAGRPDARRRRPRVAPGAQAATDVVAPRHHAWPTSGRCEDGGSDRGGP